MLNSASYYIGLVGGHDNATGAFHPLTLYVTYFLFFLIYLKSLRKHEQANMIFININCCYCCKKYNKNKEKCD